ncbi:MAG: hypothetical protein ACYCQJ_06970 [Nitrososphaerales archaeon]
MTDYYVHDRRGPPRRARIPQGSVQVRLGTVLRETTEGASGMLSCFILGSPTQTFPSGQVPALGASLGGDLRQGRSLLWHSDR